MKIKHSKFRNTGLIFELLVKQIAADTLSKKDSSAVGIIRKFYTGKTTLAKEFKLYEFILRNKNVSTQKASNIISTITEISRKLNQDILKKQKYQLIAEIKKSYNIEEFFNIQVSDYKPLAALYCLLEAQNNDQLVDPDYLVNNRTTILEHLTSNEVSKSDVEDSVIQEFAKYDKDLKLLTFKILLEKFNDRYKDFSPEHKNILREFITSVNSTTRLRNVINEELGKISKAVTKLIPSIKNDVIKIKLEEVAKNIIPISKKEKVSDTHLVNIMQYYDLIKELKNL
jgi:hypothetical protein|tara:strand:+ start:274 stop:1128 length:855 start_codon:yes stop_codon:yes gene_type:complete